MSRIFSGWLPDGGVHALRTTAAALLALYLAYLLELDTPQSAAVTVLIVSGPVHGMVVSKSLYRLGGTLVGALAAIVLMECFAQTPELFLLAVGLWMGLCTAISTLLRNFRSYGAVLAGYTVALVVFPAVNHPDHLFTLLVSRVSAVGLGVLCSAFVASLTTPRTADRTLERQIRAVLGELAGHARLALSPVGLDVLAADRARVAGKIAALDSLVEFAAVETSAMARLSDSLRASVIAMFGSLTTAAAAHSALAALKSENGAVAALHRLLDTLAAAAGEDAGALVRLQDLRREMASLARRMDEMAPTAALSELRAQDRLREMLDELALALDGPIGLLGGEVATGRQARIGVHRDLRWAAINGLRAMLLVWLTGALWLGSGWSEGGLMETITIPNAGLLAMRDRPAEDTVDFLKGLLIAVGLGWIWLLQVLPNINGFPLLALVLAPVLFVAALVATRPKHLFIGIGLAVFFPTLLEPHNPMVYDPSRFLEMSLACIVGCILTATAFRLVLPMDQHRHVRLLVKAIQADLKALMSGRGGIQPATWETRMHDRLLRLGGRLRAVGADQAGLMRGGFAALRLGREVLRARALLAPSGEGQAVAAPALAALGAIWSAPREAVHALRVAARRLNELAAGEPAAQAAVTMRAAASLTEIALLLGTHRRFLLDGRIGAGGRS